MYCQSWILDSRHEYRGSSDGHGVLHCSDFKKPEANGDPKTRPVCCCARSINGELSEYMSDLLEAAIDTRGSKESISSEDLLSLVDKAVRDLISKGYPPGEIFIGSLDVKALWCL